MVAKEGVVASFFYRGAVKVIFGGWKLRRLNHGSGVGTKHKTVGDSRAHN